MSQPACWERSFVPRRSLVRRAVFMVSAGDNGKDDRMADQCPKHQAVELLRRSRGPDAARQAEAELPDPVDLRRDAALLVSLGLTMGQLMDDLGASP